MPGPLERVLDRDLAEFMGRQASNAPLNAPTGVRAALTMTISSLMANSP